MIKFHIKAKSKKITGLCPENWQEVTLKQVLDLEKADRSDKLQILSCFTGLDLRTIENAKGDLFEPMYQVLSFITDAPKWDKVKRPKEVTLKDKSIKPPKDISLETFGQKWRAMEAIQAHENKIDCIPDILAIYFQPSYDGIFESSRIEDVKEMVYDMPAYQAMPYGFFFFKKLTGWKVIGMIGLKLSLRTLKNLLSMQKRAGRSLNPSAT
jgi:hypothetical protein